jgi:hypothetical protein
MRGWHNLYENEHFENIAGALQQVEAFGGSKMVGAWSWIGKHKPRVTLMLLGRVVKHILVTC